MVLYIIFRLNHSFATSLSVSGLPLSQQPISLDGITAAERIYPRSAFFLFV